MEDTAENITPDMMPEVPPTSFLRMKILRAQIRQLNKVDEARGGELTARQHGARHTLMKTWDKLSTVRKIDILEELLRIGVVVALVVLPLPVMAADKDLTAYDKYPEVTATVYSAEEIDFDALIHSYEPPKGKKVYYYRAVNSCLVLESTKRWKKTHGHKVRDLRPDSVIHPRINRGARRIAFWFPWWQLGTDAAVKGAVGYGASRGF